MELLFRLDHPSPAKQAVCTSFLLFYCAVSSNVLPVDSVPKEVGGYCIPYAQRECRDLSDPLYEGIFKPTATTDVCQLFATYHSCIQQIILNCPITPEEESFYDTSFVQFFNKEYECHISTTTGKLHQQHSSNGGSVKKWNSLLMCGLWLLVGYFTSVQ
ncbi:uncharacterized protein LOC110453701 [Mizuhopecten yessoensis]|uniref:uncharacterized protein LOC110453701 n=1 Tax=Mizuhopecten yessoensis TaxID=6573 RepID=UPI000B459EB6|nr:uncharacterized protein LOC110453701 [Mizuhopecten yessoensis]